MAISTIIKIDGFTISRMLKSYKVGENIMWADSTRNMAGSLRADFVGEFPKIELEFRDGLTSTEVRKIAAALRKPFLRSNFTAQLADKSSVEFFIAMIIQLNYSTHSVRFSKVLVSI